MKNDSCGIPITIKILGVLLAVIVVLYFVGKFLGYIEVNAFLKDHGSLVGAVLGALVLTATVYFTIARQSADVQKQIEAQKNIQDDVRLNDKKEAFVFSLSRMFKEFDQEYFGALECLASFLKECQKEEISKHTMPEELKVTLSSIKYLESTREERVNTAMGLIISLTSHSTYEADMLNQLYFKLAKYDELKSNMRKLEDMLITIHNEAIKPNPFKLIGYFEEQYKLYKAYEKLKEQLMTEVVRLEELCR